MGSIRMHMGKGSDCLKTKQAVGTKLNLGSDGHTDEVGAKVRERFKNVLNVNVEKKCFCEKNTLPFRYFLEVR